MNILHYKKIELKIDFSKLHNKQAYWLNEALKMEGINIDDYQVIFCSYSDNLLPLLKEPEASCYDVSIENDVFFEKPTKLSTGVKALLKPGLQLNLYPRSSTFDKYNIILANGVGKIESSYRGVILANSLPYIQNTPIKLKAKDKNGNRNDFFQLEITQIMNHIQYPRFGNYGQLKILGIVNQYVYDNWSNLFTSIRGAGGFGSTDKI